MSGKKIFEFNRVVVGCDTSRRTKGIIIFKFLEAKNDQYKKWREEWLSKIIKTRFIGQALQEKMFNDSVHKSEKHSKSENTEICNYIALVSFLTLSPSFNCCFKLVVAGLTNHQHKPREKSDDFKQEI